MGFISTTRGRQVIFSAVVATCVSCSGSREKVNANKQEILHPTASLNINTKMCKNVRTSFKTRDLVSVVCRHAVKVLNQDISNMGYNDGMNVRRLRFEENVGADCDGGALGFSSKNLCFDT